MQEFQHATWPRRHEIVASISDSRLRQLGRRLVAFYSPELLTADEMALFKAYLRDKWSAPDITETEWTTFEKAQTALSDLRAADAAEPRELDAIASFLCARCAGGA